MGIELDRVDRVDRVDRLDRLDRLDCGLAGLMGIGRRGRMGRKLPLMVLCAMESRNTLTNGLLKWGADNRSDEAAAHVDPDASLHR